MDRANNGRHNNRKGKKAPRVPIKTYRWEDIRRSRKKGGYPWTYLYKPPFNENVDPDIFTIDALRRSKSASTMATKHDEIEITELSTEDRKDSFNAIVTDPDDHSITKSAPSSSVLIIECPNDVENGVKHEEGLNSAESSDNISQYLDKEERVEEEKIVSTPESSRAKSEEPSKQRKRKLSAESSYSRISLSKLAVMKKLKEAKNKIKVPKISFPASKFRKPAPGKKHSPTQTKKDVKKEPVRKSLVTDKPVYIHIPLKPPPGETDEFSYLEFGEKKPEEKKKKDIKINPAFKGLLKSVRELGEKEKQIEIAEESTKVDEKQEEIIEKMDIEETKEIKDTVEEKQVPISMETVVETIKSETQPTTSEEPNPSEDKAEESEEEDVFERFFKKPERSENLTDTRQVRSKSAEPERKRKLSLESAYSRKSLSKLAFMKRLKEASEKVRSTFSRSGSSKKTKPKEKSVEEVIKKPVQKAVNPLKDVKPVYIHIPLKPPEGQTDQFSYLEFGDKKSDAPKPESPIEETPVTAPSDVQIIFLTAPSDDEILDEKSPEPETPSSENVKFFSNKIDELKALAQHVVDEISPDTKKNKLEPVKEESSSASSEEIKEREETKEKMMVDEEDGLSEAPKQELKPALRTDGSPILKKKVSFKRKTKTSTKDEGDYEVIEAPKDEKPVVEKKEHDLKKLPVLQMSQSMSTDEEKSYLDKKIIKDTSLEEDYNKWSKLSDHDNHEYEPINPPAETTVATFVTPSVTIIDTEKFKDFQDEADSTRVLPSTTELKNSELKIEKRIERAEPRISGQSSAGTGSSGGEAKREIEDAEPMAEVVGQKAPQGPSKFQAFKQKTDQLKTKLHNIKRPSITMPRRPSFQKPKFNKPEFKKFKFEKPNIHFPKIPDTMHINLPSFTLPKRSKTSKRTLKTRQFSTESNAGDSDGNKKPIFDFGTYPRLFKKKQQRTTTTEFATMPRTKNIVEQSTVTTTTSTSDKWGGSDSIRIPLHSQESGEEVLDLEEQEYIEDEKDREDSLERRMQEASRPRYEEDIDVDDAYRRENDEINKAEAQRRWQHGSFKGRNTQITDLDSPDDNNTNAPQFKQESLEDQNSIPGFRDSADNIKNRYSSDESGGPRIGVMEEIGSDEFVIRQKGISQENIEYRKYLSSEIREAFRSPTNALSNIQADPYRDYPTGSIQSLPEAQNKKKPAKKPRRKKTPHHSEEQLPYEDESFDEFSMLPPSRPKRRSRKVKKQQKEEPVPYQETIPPESERLMFPRESLGILGDDEREDIDLKVRERFELQDKNDYQENKPDAPARKQKSLKSLNLSENDSRLGFSMVSPDSAYNTQKTMGSAKPDDHPEPPRPPQRPSRTRSRTSSLGSHLDDFRYIDQSEEALNRKFDRQFSSGTEEPPRRPSRIRSRTNSASRGTSLKDEDSILEVEGFNEEQPQIPCVEEPCVQDIRDYMGYAIVDKTKPPREPPLPPPRTPPRRRRSVRSSKSSTPFDAKFSTVPRPSNGPPVRPLRNYSTLGQMSRAKQEPVTYENKENIDIMQYVEIEDEQARNLQRGEVVEKMRDRPLPPPPRPPRKPKQVRRSLQDITSHANIIDEWPSALQKPSTVEETVSTQTEPLPDDFICEEVVREPTDTVLTPTAKRTKRSVLDPDDSTSAVKVERHLITPTHYTHEETVTHASLVVEPLDGAQLLPDSQVTKSTERIIPVSRPESDNEETSFIPEEFTKLKDPKPEVFKTQKLQVGDLDVDRLTVNELLANRLIVSEIDSSSIVTGEISSKTGALRVGEIELPPGLVQELVRSARTETDDPGQKKNSDC